MEKFLEEIDSEAMRHFMLFEKRIKIVNGVEVTRSKCAGRYLIRDEDGSIIAAAQYVVRGRRKGIANIIVREDKRRQGIGTRLVQAILADCPSMVVIPNFTEDGRVFFYSEKLQMIAKSHLL